MDTSTITYSRLMAPTFTLGASDAHRVAQADAQGYVTLARRYER